MVDRTTVDTGVGNGVGSIVEDNDGFIVLTLDEGIALAGVLVNGVALPKEWLAADTNGAKLILVVGKDVF